MKQSSQFQIVHFVTDPMTEGRFPIAALVRSGDQQVCVPARWIPDSRCLGGERNSALIRMLLHDLTRLVADTRSPATQLGPHVHAGDWRPLPSALAVITDAAQWLTRHVLPQPPATHVHRSRGPRRSTLGWRALHKYKVAKHVEKTFDPEHDDGPVLSKGFAGLHIISQYVPGSREFLLMEPVIAGRQSTGDDVKEIAGRFVAYLWGKEKKKVSKNASLLAYVTEDGTAAERRKAIDGLGEAAETIVDMSVRKQRDEFIERILAAGHTKRGQGHIAS